MTRESLGLGLWEESLYKGDWITIVNRTNVAACGRNPGCSQAHNLGTPTECLTAQRKMVAQHDFVAHHNKFVAQGDFVAEYKLRNVLNILFCSIPVFTIFRDT